MTAQVWLIIAVVAVTGLGVEIVALHHRRGVKSVERAQLGANGWTKVKVVHLTGEAWKCPVCRCHVYGWWDVKAHVQVCAPRALDGPPPPPEPHWQAEQVPAPAGVDTWRDSSEEE